MFIVLVLNLKKLEALCNFNFFLFPAKFVSHKLPFFHLIELVFIFHVRGPSCRDLAFLCLLFEITTVRIKRDWKLWAVGIAYLLGAS